jgi:hypothetical protein
MEQIAAGPQTPQWRRWLIRVNVPSRLSIAVQPFVVRHCVSLTAGLYGVIALTLFQHYQYKLYPDTISYISIAHKYLNGDVANAVNGYWAPLLSWAMLPFLSIGFDSLESIKLVSILAGVATIVSASRLFTCFGVAAEIRRLMLLTLIFPVLYFSMSMATPDLLVAALLTAYFALIFRDDYANSKMRGVWCGLLGGLAYLAKHYALPFFIIHFTVLNVWHYKRNQSSRTVLLNACTGLLTCVLLALPWAGALSAKYGMATIGTSGARTYAYAGPHSRGDTLGPQGLVAPPNPTATSAWEDPSYDMLERWSPFESREHLVHQLSMLTRNVREVLTYVLIFSPLSMVILIAYVALGVRNSDLGKWAVPLFTMALYTAGYVGIWVEERYFWPLCLFLMMMAGVWLTSMTGAGRLGKSARYALAGVCLGSFTVLPVLNLARDFDSGKELHDLGVDLRDRYGVSGNIASHNQYRTPLYLSYYIGGHFFGTSDRKLSETRTEELILNNNIDFYFVWAADRHNHVPGFLSKYREITGGDMRGLLVYKIKENGAR